MHAGLDEHCRRCCAQVQEDDSASMEGHGGNDAAGTLDNDSHLAKAHRVANRNKLPRTSGNHQHDHPEDEKRHTSQHDDDVSDKIFDASSMRYENHSKDPVPSASQDTRRKPDFLKTSAASDPPAASGTAGTHSPLDVIGDLFPSIGGDYA